MSKFDDSAVNKPRQLNYTEDYFFKNTNFPKNQQKQLKSMPH